MRLRLRPYMSYWSYMSYYSYYSYRSRRRSISLKKPSL